MQGKTSRLNLMSRNYLVVALAVAILVTPFQATAAENPAVKNGNPCVEEMCINDEPKDLLQLKWKPVPVAKTTYESYVKAIGDPAAAKIFSRYWAVQKIDGAGLQALSKLKGFCENPVQGRGGIDAEYTNSKGQPVMVSFLIVPSEDGKSQKFVATNILKFIARGDFTPEQYADLNQQAKAQYQKYYQREGYSQYPNVSITGNGGAFLHIKSQYGQMDPPNGIVVDPSKFKYFPGCGADKKLKL